MWPYNVFVKGASTGDFLYYWVASSLAMAGKGPSVFNFSMFKTALESANAATLLTPWFYPPTFLLMVLPLSLLPYQISLSVWLLITILGFIIVIYRIAPKSRTIWLTLAFPATIINTCYVQNGFLSAALFGGGLALLDRYPFVAGLLFGLLTYKPHLTALIPVALIAGRQWRPLLGSITSLGFMILVSVLVLGGETWVAFWENLPFTASLILGGGAQGYINNWQQIVTAYAIARLAGSGPLIALFLQGTVMVIALGIVIWVWVRGASLPVRASVLTLCALLFTPYARPYDLTIMALPIAWIGWEGYTKGWLPGERGFLFIAWCSPLISTIPIPGKITPLILVIYLLLVLRRMKIAGNRETSFGNISI